MKWGLVNIKKLRAYIDFSDKVKGDMVWSVAGFLVIGICGVTLTFLTAKFYSTATLGLLNTVLIIYTIYSQLANFGIHFAVIKYVSEYKDNIEVLTIILRSSLFATLTISALFSLIFYILTDFISSFFLIEKLSYALRIIAPSILLFTMNKVLLSYYNGIRSMKLYSIFFAFRFIAWIILLIIFAANGFLGEKLSYIFLISELLLFIILLLSVFKVLFKKTVHSHKKWSIDIINFGFKSVIGSIFADFNTRIDVLILGMFQNASVVGIYSFATMFVDGFGQLGIVFRINMNPILTSTYFISGKDKLKQKIIKVRNTLYILLFGVIAVTLIIFPFLISFIGVRSEYELSFIPLLILSSGIVLSSGYLPFQMIFNQTGFPLYQTLFYITVFLINVLMNILLVPSYGMYGCAIATSLSYLSVPFILNILNKRTLGFAF